MSFCITNVHTCFVVYATDKWGVNNPICMCI